MLPGQRSQGNGRDFRSASMIWLGQDAQGPLMVDLQCNLIWRNAAADRMLASRHELQSCGTVLNATDAARKWALAQFVDEANELC